MHLTPDVTEADRGVPLGTTRRVSTVFAGVLLLAVAGVALAVRYVPPTNHLTIFAVVASPFLMAAFNAPST
jgi:hypothetical protein